MYVKIEVKVEMSGINLASRTTVADSHPTLCHQSHQSHQSHKSSRQVLINAGEQGQILPKDSHTCGTITTVAHFSNAR